MRIQQWFGPSLRFGFWPLLAVVVITLIVFARRSGNGSDAETLSDTDRSAAVQHVPKETLTKPRKGSDWPTFLGPHGTGVSDETGISTNWPEDGPPLLWGKRIGSGYSAPSVRGNRLVIHQRVGDEEIVECLRADTGERIWEYKYPSDFSDPYGYSNGPRCSPILTENRCYTYGAEGVLLCLKLETGDHVWTRDIKQDFNIFKKSPLGTKSPNWFFGIGCTPILEEGLLITLVGGQPNSGVVAFDAKTGKIVWENVGKDVWDGVQTDWPNEPNFQWTGEEQIVSYSTPIAVTINGKRHVLCFLRHGLVSLDPKSGKVNFKYWFRSRTYESVNAARPVVIKDKIFLSAAYRLGSVLLKVDKDGRGVSEIWRDRKNLLAHWSTPIYHDGYIYGFSGRHENEGMFRCIDLETGHVVWETDGFDGDLNDLERDLATGRIRNKKTGKIIPFPYFGRGSKIMVDDHFIVFGERGTVALCKVNSKSYEEVARTTYPQLKYPCWAAPVLSKKRLYLRCDDALICLDLSKNTPAD